MDIVLCSTNILYIVPFIGVRNAIRMSQHFLIHLHILNLLKYFKHSINYYH